ncbi:hypothetical protein B1748_21190 [Paenibacillus sp. MY03]|uniref:hypothetical protein n=1 Tax=Paenibacillus sp. MY03 TaxID=302980 RepID=UPI000B3BF6E7|nr:hypothetical protein [Paenibacillus sp. MY03]OUS74344.1 hypothetical protein B1748_21190 [Paenibacillus sp. MY03]
MLMDIILGFIIPWILGLYLIMKDLPFVFHVGSIGALISFVINDIGYFMNWWHLTPKDYGNLSFIPYNLGVFAVIAVLTVRIIQNGRKSWVVIPSATLIKTLLESVYVFSGKVVYLNGWNIGFTFVLYLFSCTLGYIIYKKTKSLSSRSRE